MPNPAIHHFSGSVNAGKVLIIGAGNSGICSARHFSEDGWDVIVAEASGSIGGIWSTAYPGVVLQNTSDEYSFQDFLASKYMDHIGTSEQVKTYIKAYVEHFKLESKIRLWTRVESLEYISFGDGASEGWCATLTTSEPGSEKKSTEEFFDFVMVAVGTFGSQPQIPTITGAETFSGKAVHTRELGSFSADELDVFVRGKRVVVLGYAKSALDLAEFSVAHGAASVHQIVRTPRWLMPESIAGVHSNAFMMNRINSCMIPAPNCSTSLEKFLHKGSAKIPRIMWSINEFIIASTQKIKKDHPLYPKHRLINDLRSSVAIAPPKYFSNVHSGKININAPTSIASINGSTIVLENGTSIPEVDILIYGTGYRIDLGFLPAKYRETLIEADGVYLYRGVIHPDIPRLAFAGFNASYVLLSSMEVGVHWVLAHLRGDAQLPDAETMRDEISRVREWTRTHLSPNPLRSGIAARFQQYHDQLLTDLGVSIYRKAARRPGIGGWFSEYFDLYGANDYDGLASEIKKASSTKAV
ncbi:hypothetical protein BJ742DRAFT_848310 [Cladochytrium replicatum]|nr:hypothetical protein BJ742DRAFT_848310 [Cladochytrium replicatum]